ncbi:MAG: hypothetical protein N2035_02170 [Chthoniobacterales bacterium]|nr:hypothetical protein [Chthoniobacterales bacterium]
MHLIDYIRHVKKKDEILIISPTAIGEAFVVVLLLEEVYNKYNRNIHLILPPHQTDILKLINVPRQYLFCGTCHYKLIASFYKDYKILNIDNGDNIVVVYPDYFFSYPFDLFKSFIDSNGIFGLDYVKSIKRVLGLNLNCLLTKPKNNLNDISLKYLEKLNLKKGQYVLFQVGSNSRKAVPYEIFFKIALYFFNKGYDIIINRANSLFQPKERFPIAKYETSFSIYHANLLALNASYVISTGSGILCSFIYLNNLSTIDTKLVHIGTNYRTLSHIPPIIFEKVSPFVNHKNCMPEIITNKKNLYEWYLPLELNKDEREKFINDVLTFDKKSFFYMGPV